MLYNPRMQPVLAADALGLGLRSVHYQAALESATNADYVELIAENFLSDALPPRYHLDRIKERYPIVLHGVGLNILGPEPPDARYLERLAALAEYVKAPFVSDHLCWTGAHGHSHHDLLPTPYVPELVELAAERARWVQAQLGRRFALENLSSYVEFAQSSLTEWDFYAGVVRRAGCYFLLDVNNLYVSSQNHGFDPEPYLSAIDFSRVLQVHVAGHSREPDGGLVDTHDRAVCDAVWQLYERAWQRGGPFPTLLEWDEHIPPFPALLGELSLARKHQP